MAASRSSQGAPWWAVIGVFVVSISLAVATALVTVRSEARAREAADREWCGYLQLEVANFQAEPPETDTGKRRQKVLTDLRNSRCTHKE
jgi:hypothetical protein